MNSSILLLSGLAGIVFSKYKIRNASNLSQKIEQICNNTIKITEVGTGFKH